MESKDGIIALFMDLVPCDRGCTNCWHWNTKSGKYILLPDYHKSWDALMPVVDKIESLGYEINISENECYILYNKKQVGKTQVAPTKLEATYAAVIKFIEYLNERKV